MTFPLHRIAFVLQPYGCRANKTDQEQNHAPTPFSTIPLSPYPRPSVLYMQGFTLRRRRLDIFPVSAGKYSSKEIKTSVRLCESALSAISLLRPRLFHSRFPPPRAVCLAWVGFWFGARGQAYGYIAI